MSKVLGNKNWQYCVLLIVMCLLIPTLSAAQQCCNLDCRSPAGCNKMTNQVVLFPHVAAEIFVTVRSVCGGNVLKSCSSSFISPNTGSPADQMRVKCHLLVAALRSPECVALGYLVSETCDVNRAFQVEDVACGASTVQLGISCDPNVFNQTGSGQPICDYEGDLMFSGCPSGEGITSEVALSGTATGFPIVSGHPPFVEFLVALVPAGSLDPPDPRQVQAFTINTIPGVFLPATEVIRRGAEQIIGAGLPGIVVSVSSDGTKLSLTQQDVFSDLRPSISIATNDNGFTIGTQVGPLGVLPPEFPGAPASPASPRSVCSLPVSFN